jgi:hypothetical protein
VAGVAVGALAVFAVWLRWGSGWLVAVGGAQAVLGPAFLVGPTSAAWSSALAALALVVAAPRYLLVAVALGATAALIACGPTADPLRLLATFIGVGAAVGASRLPWGRWRTVGAVLLAVAAVVLA